MNAADPDQSAADAGRVLDRFLRSCGEDRPDPVRTRQLVADLAAAKCQTPADALACLAQGNDLVRQCMAALGSGTAQADDVWSLLAWACLLNTRAVVALESAAGVNASTFLGSGPTLN